MRAIASASDASRPGATGTLHSRMVPSDTSLSQGGDSPALTLQWRALEATASTSGRGPRRGLPLPPPAQWLLLEVPRRWV